MRLSLKLGFMLALLLPGPPRAAAQTDLIDVLIMSKDYRQDPGLVRDRDSIASSFQAVLEPDNFGEALNYIRRIGRGGRIRRLVFLGHGDPNRPDWFSAWKPWTWGSERGGVMVTQEGANAELITETTLSGLARRLWRLGDSSLADAFAPQAEVIFLNCYVGRDPEFVRNATDLLLGFSGGTVYASPDGVVSDESAGSRLLFWLSIVMPSAEEARSHRSPSRVDYHKFNAGILPVFPARDLRDVSLQVTGPDLALTGEKVALRAVDRSGRLQSPQIAPYIRYTWRRAGQRWPLSDGIGSASPPKAGYEVLLTDATTSADITVEAFLDNGIAARKLGEAKFALKVEEPREVALRAVPTSNQDFSVTASVANGPIPAAAFWTWGVTGGVRYQGRGAEVQAHCQNAGELTAWLQMYDSQASVHTLGTASVRLAPKEAPALPVPPSAPPVAGTPPRNAPPVEAPGAAPPSPGPAAAGAWVLEGVKDETQAHKAIKDGSRTLSPGTIAFKGPSVESSDVMTNRDGTTVTRQSSTSWTEFPKILIPGAPVTIIRINTRQQPDNMPFSTPQTRISEDNLASVTATGTGSETFQLVERRGRSGGQRVFWVHYEGPGGTANRVYTYTWQVEATPPGLPSAPKTTSLNVQIEVDKPTIVPGETALLKAVATGGTPPFTFAWTGPVGGTADQLAVTAVKPGTQAFTVTVSDSTGASATSSASITTEAVTVTIRRASSGTVVLGQSFGFQAELSAAGKPVPGAFVYRWQPHPEVAYAPFEDAGTQTTAVFTRLGRTRVWVEVLRKEGPVLATVAESDQIEIDVVGPQLSLTANPSPPYPGQEVRINVTMSPAIPDKYVTFWWEIQGNALNAGPVVVGDDYSRAYTYKPKDTTPVTVTAHAKAKDGGDDLGAKAIVVTARPHTVQVTPPLARGPKPRIWDPKRGGLVEVDSQLAVFQDVSMRADVTPAPINQPVRYQWTVSPEGCTISNPISQEPTFNCSQTGDFAALVTVRDNLGATLGAGTGSIPVSISQAALQNSQTQAAAAQQQSAQEEAKLGTGLRLRSEGIELQKQGKLREAAAKYRESLSYRSDAELETIVPQLETEAARREKAAQQQQARLATGLRLRSEGIELQKKGKLREAAAKYRESLSYRPDPELETIIPQLEAEAAAKDKQKKSGWEAALGAIAGEIDAQLGRERAEAARREQEEAARRQRDEAERRQREEAEKKNRPPQTPPATTSQPPAPRPPATQAPPREGPAQAPSPQPQACSLTGEWHQVLTARPECSAFSLRYILRQDGTNISGTKRETVKCGGDNPFENYDASFPTTGSVSGRELRLVHVIKLFENVSKGSEHVFEATVSSDCQTLVGSRPEDKDVIYRRR
ncbi:MAG: hypothetical protein A3G21_21840 [Acidobacteria bacterium RIFCSPLOWO2_12_FULL_66_21]|nr:MAG: hypothetical protein A3G21_21840 [Acidobacteria bacterium RIFCSPLOWO2_12_FULL_66_21]